MFDRIVRWLSALLAALAALASPFPERSPDAGRAPPALESRLADASLAFEPNLGQARAGVGFLSRSLHHSLQLSATEAVLGFRGQAQDLRMRLLGGDPAAVGEGLRPQAGRSHYLIGNDPAAWRVGIQHFAQVLYRQVYPGIDLLYYGNGREFEYDFVVAPGSDPGRIALGFEGAQDVRLDLEGNLVLSTAAGPVVQRRPVIYQDYGTRRVAIDGRYVLSDGMVRFALGPYDRQRALVIDPVISYSTYLGGSLQEESRGIAVDRHGAIYVVGNTNSADFPVLDAIQPTQQAEGFDVFVTKYDASGAVAYSTYLGGTSGAYDSATGIAVDDAGHAYVVGSTGSPDFPTASPIQSQPLATGGIAVFISKLAPDGSTLSFGTLLGGATDVEQGGDWGRDIAVDGSGNAYVTGVASPGFPTTAGVVQQGHAFGTDAFVAKVDTVGHRLAYSSYLGRPDGHTAADAIVVDGQGSAVIAGVTESRQLPVVAALQPFNAGGADGFVARFSPDARHVTYLTYLGGSGHDEVKDLAQGPQDLAIAGITASTDFPLANPAQAAYGGGYRDAFIARIDPAGTTLQASSYFGGNDVEGFHDLALAAGDRGDLYLVGSSPSPDLPIVAPVRGHDACTGGGFLAKFSPAVQLEYSTRLCGPSGIGIRITAVAAGAGGSLHLAGGSGGDFPVIGGMQPHAGSADAVVVRLVPFRPHSDVDADRRDDILWRNHGTGAGAIWLSANASTQRPMTGVRNLQWDIVGIGDFDADDASDVVWRNHETGANVLWPAADAAAARRLAGVTDPAWRIAGIGDYDGDGRADLFWRNVATGANVIWNRGELASQRATRAVRDTRWSIVGSGDYDGDGRTDVLWRHATTGANAIWDGGDAAAARALPAVTNLAWRVAGYGDYDGDGRSDILWRHAKAGRNVIWRSADAARQGPVTGVSNLDWKVAASGDYDGDGHADVLWRNVRTGNNVVWRSADSTAQLPVTRVSNLDWTVVPAH